MKTEYLLILKLIGALLVALAFWKGFETIITKTIHPVSFFVLVAVGIFLLAFPRKK